MRPATEMSLVVTSIPAGAVNVRMIGRKELVARSGASSVRGVDDRGLLGTHRLSQEKIGGGRHRPRHRPALITEFCLILLSGFQTARYFALQPENTIVAGVGSDDAQA